MPQNVIWSPQPGPQEALVACPVFEVFFGGARGGGKTDGSLGDWLEHSNTWKNHASGVFFRRTSVQLDEVIARSHEIFAPIGAKFNVQKSNWIMPGGARLKFRYLERDSDAANYQGHSYTRVYIEEATNFPSPAPINKLRATLRSAHGVPVALRLTGNPGGPGHNWVFERYIKPNPRGWQVLVEEIPTMGGRVQKMERMFIPSKLIDNKLLLQNGDQYIAQLRQSGSDALVRAWLDGDWNVVDGAFFDTYSDGRHVLWEPDWTPRIPRMAHRFRSMDWGYAKPFAVYWFVVSDGTWGLPADALLVYREWYGWNGKADTGLRMEADLVGRGILERERADGVQFGHCDPSMFIRDGGPSIAESMMVVGCMWARGDNRRQPGWQEVRRRLRPINEAPMLYFLSNCQQLIRTIKTVQHDETNVEDLDTDGEDHAVDALRYGCMARPYRIDSMPAPPVPLQYPRLPGQMTIFDILEQNKRQLRDEREEIS